MKKFVLIYGLLGVSIFLNAQQRITISGYVTDSVTGEVLIGASVYELETSRGCTSNEFGYYSISIGETSGAILEVSYIGYSKQQMPVHKGSQSINFRLQPGISINEITLLYEAPKIQIRENSNAIQLNMDEVRKLPTLFGENDLVQALRLMPGVQSGDEGKSQLFVRGGSPDQNLVLLDDVPMYYISHFSGLFSIFNSDAIHHVEMIKGGFPARYGGRLSSVIDVRMKEGNLYESGGTCAIGLLSSRISYEGPIKEGQSSYILSARRSVLPIMKLITEGMLNNSFYDLNAKINLKIKETDRLFFSFYHGGDNVKIKQFDAESKINKLVFSNENNWGNSLAAFRWNHIFSQNLFSNLTISGVQYQYGSSVFQHEERDSVSYDTNSELFSGITDLNASYDLRWYFHPKYTMRGGVKTTWHYYKPNNESMHQTTSTGLKSDTTFANTISAFESSIYVENEFNLKYLTGNIGGRLAGYSVNGRTFFYAEPRINVSFDPSSWFQLNASYARMNQFIHLLSYSNAGFPNDYWMPATEMAKPEFSEQTSLGMNFNFPGGLYSLSLVVFQKRMEDLVAFKDGATLYGNMDRWENVVETGGRGNSKGMEVLFEKTKGRTTGWISTTWSKAMRQFDNINKGNEFPFKYDRRLDLSVVINHQINEKVDLSLVWNYGSGYPVTLAIGKYQLDKWNEILIWGERNSFRMKDYHRLDLAINYPYTIGKFDGRFSISVLNVYNRKNPYYYFYLNMTGKITRLYQQNLFPFLPSFSYSFKF